MGDTDEFRTLSARIHQLEQEGDLLKAALESAQGQQLEREGVRAIPVGTIPIDSASLMVVDPLFVEANWVRGSEASATGVAYGPALDAKELGEGLSADGHRVEWINPIQFVATPKEGVTLDVLQARTVELWQEAHRGMAEGVGGARVGLVRPGATVQIIQEGKATAAGGAVVNLSSGSIGYAGAAILSLGGDGHAGIVALVDNDGFVQRIEIDLHT